MDWAISQIKIDWRKDGVPEISHKSVRDQLEILMLHEASLQEASHRIQELDDQCNRAYEIYQSQDRDAISKLEALLSYNESECVKIRGYIEELKK